MTMNVSNDSFFRAAAQNKGANVLLAGTLKDGEPFTIELLNDSHVADFMRLHEDVRRHLPEDEKGFLLPKDPELLYKHLNRGGGNALIGARSGSRQMAQAIIVHPEPGNEDYSIMRPRHPVAEPENITFMQAAAVHPEWRGHGLLQEMIKAWTDHASSFGRRYMLAEVKAKNEASMSAFLKAGLHIASLTRDPVREDDVYNFTLKTGSPPVRVALVPGTGLEVKIGDISAQKQLFESGYIVYDWKKAARSLLMAQKEPEAKRMFEIRHGMM